MKYTPLVKNIANYFYSLNSGVEHEDLVQEGFVGLLMAEKKYNPCRGVSLGAFASTYIFGRIYRSLLGTKNLIHNKKMRLLELTDNIECKGNDHQFLTELSDFIETKYPNYRGEALKLFISGHKKAEIIRQFAMQSQEFDDLINGFVQEFQ